MIPGPNTCHPSLEHIADAVRSAPLLDYQIRFPVLQPTVAQWDRAEEPIAPEIPFQTLLRRKCMGPAPYVGRPFAYIWWAWVTDDGTNRAITTDSEFGLYDTLVRH